VARRYWPSPRSPASHAWLAGDGAIPVSYGPGLRRDIEAVLRVGALIDLHTPEYLDLAGRYW
jgi:hypothetical protein